MSKDDTPIFDSRLSDFTAEPNAVESGESPLKMLWRHKLLILVFAAVGSGWGYWKFLQKPTTYGASTQLMIKSESPLTLDAVSGNVIGGVPSSDILSAVIYSDQIMQVAAIDPELTALSTMKDRSASAIAGNLRGGLKFSPRTSNTSSNDRLVAVLSFDGSEPDTCVAAVNATSRAIQAYFNRERESSVNRLSDLIDQAEKKLLPQLTELEGKYQDFRRVVKLEWDSTGEVINPHRARQTALVEQQIKVEQELRQLNSTIRLIESVWEKNKDIELVTYLISQAGGNTISSAPVPGNTPLLSQPESNKFSIPELRDLELDQLNVEQTLVPMLVEQKQMVTELGPNHPAVRTLEAQIATTRRSLNDLALQRQHRIEELERNRRAERDAKAGNGQETAAKSEDVRMVESHLITLKGRSDLIVQQIAEIETLIEREKTAANELTQAEKDDQMYQRQIARVQGMLVQLEERMAGMDINAVNNGLVVQPLFASVTANITGPDMKKDLSFFGMVGLAVGCMLSYLIDANSRMFRSSEQLAAALKVPVITHIPLDEVSLSRKQSKSTDKKAALKLAVVNSPESAAAEAMRCIRTAVFFESKKTGNKVYQITSPLPGDGKSTIAANLATSIAIAGKKVLLIDLDLRSPRLTSRFGLEKSEGITNLLNGDCDPLGAIHESAIPNLSVLPCGKIPSNPAEALGLPEMSEAFDWFREQYDYIIVDTPPLLLVTDPAIVTHYVDSTLLIMRIVRGCKPNALEAMGILRNAGAAVMGVLVNKVDDVSVGKYYQVGGNGGYRDVGYGYGKRYRNDRLKAGNGEQFVVSGGTGLKARVNGRLNGSHVATIDQDSIELLDDLEE